MEREVNESGLKQFLINLQLEYLTHHLRAIIYQEKTYAKVACDIAARKRLKIKQLGERFAQETIFDENVDVDKFIEKYFWNKKGLPNFKYKDEQQKRVQGNYDKWYLLYRGTLVVYNVEIVEVISNNPAKDSADLRINDKKVTVSYSDISLIKNNYKWI